MSKNTVDIANALLAEKAALEARVKELEEKYKVEIDGANERGKLLFDAKNHWADRARAAEEELARLKASDVINSLLLGCQQQRFVVKRPDDGLDDCIRDWPDQWRNNFDCGYNYAIWRFMQEIEESGGEIAE